MPDWKSAFEREMRRSMDLTKRLSEVKAERDRLAVRVAFLERYGNGRQDAVGSPPRDELGVERGSGPNAGRNAQAGIPELTTASGNERAGSVESGVKDHGS